MMKNQKTIRSLIFPAVALLVCLSVSGMMISSRDTTPEQVDAALLPIQPMRGSFVCDPYDINESVGIADYVFVGTVERNEGTEYRNMVTMADEHGQPIEVGSPYTNYSIQVLSNIKGNLRTDAPIEVVKHGGVAQDHSAVYVFEDDFLPEEQETYVFLTYAQPDGSLLISGPNSNILLDDCAALTNDPDSRASSVVDAYLDAFEHEIIPISRKRFTSKYEAE